MKIRTAIAAAILLTSTTFHAQNGQDNTLTAAEHKAGWTLLFDGKSTSAFRQGYASDFPAHGWVVKDGELRGEFTSGAEAGDGGDIVTRETYANFELYFDWKLGPGGNSGVKYFVEERHPKPKGGSLIGYEYQLIDDANYSSNGKQRPPNLKTASIYDVVAANKQDTVMGQWHRSHIRVEGNHITHWLDGKQVVNVERTSQQFKDGVATSKFHDYSNFSSIAGGHILLQDHGHNVAFKNLKIRRLAQ